MQHSSNSYFSISKITKVYKDINSLLYLIVTHTNSIFIARHEIYMCQCQLFSSNSWTVKLAHSKTFKHFWQRERFSFEIHSVVWKMSDFVFNNKIGSFFSNNQVYKWKWKYELFSKLLQVGYIYIKDRILYRNEKKKGY